MNSEHGGARSGSGRPPGNPVRGSKVKRTIALYPDTWEALDQYGNSYGTAIQLLLDSVLRGATTSALPRAAVAAKRVVGAGEVVRPKRVPKTLEQFSADWCKVRDLPSVSLRNSVRVQQEYDAYLSTF